MKHTTTWLASSTLALLLALGSAPTLAQLGGGAGMGAAGSSGQPGTATGGQLESGGVGGVGMGAAGSNGQPGSAGVGQLESGSAGDLGAGTTPGPVEGGVGMRDDAGLTGGRFGRADVNRDQRIDQQEYRNESANLFSGMDSDQSGQISESEFNNRRAVDFGAADRDTDGGLNSGEYTGFYGSGNAGYSTGVTGSDTRLGTPAGNASP